LDARKRAEVTEDGRQILPEASGWERAGNQSIFHAGAGFFSTGMNIFQAANMLPYLYRPGFHMTFGWFAGSVAW
jgi:hypothetical protein